MKKQTIYIYLICFLSVLSCSKDKGCIHNTTNFEIPESDRKIVIPYKTGFEEIFFIRAKSKDTFMFKGQGWKTDFTELKTELECYQINNLQRWYNVYKDSIDAESIIIQFLHFYPGAPYLQIDYNNNTYIAAPTPYSQDSLTIQNQTYYNVQSFCNDYQPERNTGYKCFYNRKNGILKMETNDGDTIEFLYFD